MNIIVKKANILEEKSDLLVLGHFFGTKTFVGPVNTLDKKLGGLITKIAAEENFASKTGELLVIQTHGKLPQKRLLIVGLGEKKTFGTETIRRLAGAVVRYADKVGATKIFSELPVNNLNTAVAAQALTEGALLADYKYLIFKPEETKRLKKRGLVTWTLVEADGQALRLIEKGIATGEIYSRATIYARDLVNEPGNRLAPAHLVAHAEKLAQNNPGIKLKVLDKEACEKLGMGLFLAVAKGSDEPPYFIHLSYAPAKAKKKIVLVGKGITFDSGGLSLKPTWAMLTMKSDMAGAAAVLGAFSVIADLEPEVEVHGLIATCENMINGRAMRVDDIVAAMNGKSVEINNTDAEGRLTLADALSYAVKKIKPDYIYDMATLTGSMLAALGFDIAGLIGNDDKLSQQIKNAAAAANEDVCQLPLHEDYLENLKGSHADLLNTAPSRYGDAIEAAVFLNEFVDNTPWAHLDFGGPAFALNANRSYIPKGGTGFGVRTILNWLKSF